MKKHPNIMDRKYQNSTTMLERFLKDANSSDYTSKSYKIAEIMIKNYKNDDIIYKILEFDNNMTGFEIIAKKTKSRRGMGMAPRLWVLV